MTYAELVKAQAKPGQFFIAAWHTEEYQHRPYWHGWPPVLYLFATRKDAARMVEQLRGTVYRNAQVVRVSG